MEPREPVGTEPPEQAAAQLAEQAAAPDPQPPAASVPEQPTAETVERRAEESTDTKPYDGEPSRRRIITFRVLVLIPVLFFLVAELNLLSPWVFILPTEDAPKPHRWFFVVSASADLLGLVSVAGLFLRPRLTGLAAWVVASVGIVLVTIVPFQPFFLLVVAVLLLPAGIAYPYRRDLLAWRTWWTGARRPLLALAAAAGVVLLVSAIAAIGNQIDGTGSAADANWWNDYAEHSTDIALVGLLAASRAPGALLLRGVLSLVWIYLGVIAVFVLPDYTGSWGVAGGLGAIAVGIAFAFSTWVDRADWPFDRRMAEGTRFSGRDATTRLSNAGP